MPKPDKTVFVVDTPIEGPEDRTITTYEFYGDTKALRKLTIAVSREVGLGAIVAHLQRILDTETQKAQNSPQGTANSQPEQN